EAGLRIAERPIPTYYGDEICYVNGFAYAFHCVKTALRYRLHRARMTYDAKYDVKGDRYVYKKADPYSSHAQIINWVSKERPAQVLEVGTATGFLTSELVALGCTVTGIEQDAAMASLARQHCAKMIEGNVETLDFDGL